MNKAIDIVNWAVPYPANYGGAIDVFYKIKNLHALGYEINLHCFTYGRFTEQEELKKYCKNVYYYPRASFLQSIFSKIPFIVASRANVQLRDRLLQTQNTILLEGAHCTYWLPELLKANKSVIVRTHNLENVYYAALANAEKSWWRQIYYRIEAKRLLNHEAKQLNATSFIHVNQKEQDWFIEKYPNVQHYCVPTFQTFDTVQSKIGVGTYGLFHGNLAVAENNNAAIYLIENVFSKIDYSIIIAGYQPSEILRNEIAKHRNIQLIDTPSPEKMSALIADAQMHILYSEQSTGVKLKVLNALFHGRHVLINKQLAEGNSLGTACIICENAEAYIAQIKSLRKVAFTDELLAERKKVLDSTQSNCVKIKMLLKVLDV